MDLALFLIFLFCDLLIVPVCGFAYGKQGIYREGMLLGIHIPPDCLHHPDLEAILKKSQKHWKLFQRLNLIFGLLVCLLCFSDFIVFIILWSVWLGEYVIGLYALILTPHRRLYRLKLANGWVQEESKHIVRIDTVVSASSTKTAVSWKWQLPILLLTALTGILVSGIAGKYHMASAEILPVWILYFTAVGLCILFLALHLWFAHSANRVYSQNTEVNLAVNGLIRHAWTKGLAFSAWLNGAAWLCLIIPTFFSGPILSGLFYFLYTFVLILAAAALLIPVGLSVKKRRQVLDSDPTPCYTDDDEYWKMGWYSNPEDTRLFVPSRFNSIQFSLNFGRPGAKTFIGIIIASVLLLLLWSIGSFLKLSHAEITFDADSPSFRFEAARYDCSFDRDEIQSVTLTDTLPEDDFVRTNGASTRKVNLGYYRGEKTGKCMMFRYNDSTPILKIRLDDLTVYVSSEDPDLTLDWYETLKEALG